MDVSDTSVVDKNYYYEFDAITKKNGVIDTNAQKTFTDEVSKQ